MEFKSTLIFFIALMIISGIIFLYVEQGVKDCGSALGQLSRMLSGEIQQKCAKAGLVYLGSFVVFIFSSLMAAIYTAIILFMRNKMVALGFVIVVIIITLRLSGVL